ncbi:extensin-like domain-containing protein [Rhizobium rhizophilum]|uniref:Extensin n=1 Tax=Rhizobium rhizophilum TaxID=1850373 RepID=A0ABY2QXZ4_9HYPH|nr:extensin family protein [Rhizobium rhizophilum]THV15582.1 extensin [Rhizobium rhizophilum]
MTKTLSRVAIGLLLAWPIATGLTLPTRGPLPETRPEVAAPAPPADGQAAENATPDASADVPTPQTKPATPAEASGTQAEEAAPEAKGIPQKPSETSGTTETGKDETSDGTPPAAEPEEKAAPVDPPPPTEDPTALAACLADLRTIGASFETDTAIDDAGGCGIAAPVTLKKVLPDVTLEPEATIRCETALQLARMTRDMLKPAAEAAFPGKPKLTGIRHASGYVCRKRNSAETGKVSEHAFGNAIDIAGLRFGDTEEPVMIAKQHDGTAEAAFQRAFNALACLYFTTVLSPGSDPTHQDHMHLDVIERKSGYRYCR